MQQTLITIRYSISGDPSRFRSGMEKAAATIAATPGLIWKIWGFDTDHSVGISAYLFESERAAASFALGPVIRGLRNHPDVDEVSLEIAPVDRELSERTGATAALAARPLSPAGTSR
jgi:hypothetical protein